MGTPRRAYLGLGSNLGDRLAQLQSAVDRLGAEPGVAVVGVSSVYESAAVGGPPDQPEYLNAVVAIDTALGPHELLDIARRLETAAGRVRTQAWGPRTLDVDILLVGDEEVAEPDLVIPHPRMWGRAFVVMPLADLAPSLVSGATEQSWTGTRRAAVALVVPEGPPTGTH